MTHSLHRAPTQQRSRRRVSAHTSRIRHSPRVGFCAGGSGNDYLTYAFGGTQCPPPSDYKQCLNQSHWASLLSFTQASKSKMVFGSMNTGRDDNDARDAVTDPDTDASSAGIGNPTPGFPFPWDPSNARQILQWTIDQGLDHLIFGFELGK